MSPVPISQVVNGFTVTKYAKLVEEQERMAAVNIRLGQIEAEQERRKAWAKARETEAIAGLGRCEYSSLRHAQWKESMYRRAIKSGEWEAFQIRKIQQRFAEREQKKAERQGFDPEQVEPALTHLPDF